MPHTSLFPCQNLRFAVHGLIISQSFCLLNTFLRKSSKKGGQPPWGPPFYPYPVLLAGSAEEPTAHIRSPPHCPCGETWDSPARGAESCLTKARHIRSPSPPGRSHRHRAHSGAFPSRSHRHRAHSRAFPGRSHRHRAHSRAFLSGHPGLRSHRCRASPSHGSRADAPACRSSPFHSRSHSGSHSRSHFPSRRSS